MNEINKYSEFPAYVRDFFAYMTAIQGRSLRTVDGYSIDIRNFLRYIKVVQLQINYDNYSEITISDVTIEMISEVTLSDLHSFLNFTMTHNDNVSKTRARKASALRSLFKYLTTKSKLIPENPAKELELPTVGKTLPKYLSLDESKNLLSSVKTRYSERDYCIITLFLNCGMRLSELVGINLKDVRDNSIKLLGKGNKERVVYLNDACMAAIENYLKIRKAPDKIDALFLSNRGTRVTPRRVEQIVEDCLRTAGLSDVGYTPHKLRHTAATLLYRYGEVDIRILKEILGHASISTTEIYTHVSNSQIEAAAEKSPLSGIFRTDAEKSKENENE